MSDPNEPVYYANKCTRHSGGFWYANASTDRRFVEIHYYPEPIVSVRVRERTEGDPPSNYWGWLATDEPGRYLFVWPSEGQLEMCFAYGSKAEADRGRGRKVNLIVEETP